MVGIVARRYGQALFELGIENNTLPQWVDQVIFIRNAFVQNADFFSTITHPQISKEQKMTILKNVFKDNEDPAIFGFFDVVLSKNREAELIGIFDWFIGCVRQHQGVTTAYVTTATALDETHLNKIKAVLAKKLNKQIEVVVEVDGGLIGGLCIKVDGYVIDSSIKSQLHDIKRKLTGLQLA